MRRLMLESGSIYVLWREKASLARVCLFRIVARKCWRGNQWRHAEIS